jgi:hypothetical protein
MCSGACVLLTGSDSLNCGACGHSCLNGTCVAGACQPFAIASNLTGLPGPLQLDGANLYWTEADTNTLFVLNTSTSPPTLTPMIASGQRTVYRLDGNTFVNKFGSSFTTFDTCTLSSKCAAQTIFSPSNTTGGDFQIDESTQRLFYTDLSFPDMVQATSLTAAWNPSPFLTLPVGFNSVVMLGLINGFIYGMATPNAGGPPFVLWRSASAPSTNTASILSTQIPGVNASFPVSANSTKIFLFTSANTILSFPPNGSGAATPTLYFNAGAFGGMVADWATSTAAPPARAPRPPGPTSSPPARPATTPSCRTPKPCTGDAPVRCRA